MTASCELTAVLAAVLVLHICYCGHRLAQSLTNCSTHRLDVPFTGVMLKNQVPQCHVANRGLAGRFWMLSRELTGARCAGISTSALFRGIQASEGGHRDRQTNEERVTATDDSEEYDEFS